MWPGANYPRIYNLTKTPLSISPRVVKHFHDPYELIFIIDLNAHGNTTCLYDEHLMNACGLAIYRLWTLVNLYHVIERSWIFFSWFMQHDPVAATICVYYKLWTRRLIVPVAGQCDCPTFASPSAVDVTCMRYCLLDRWEGDMRSIKTVSDAQGSRHSCHNITRDACSSPSFIWQALV